MTDDHAHPLITETTGKMFETSHPELVRLYTPKIESRWRVKSMMKNHAPNKYAYNSWFKNY